MNTFCTYFNQGICTSCDLITMDYADQIIRKEQKLIEALAGFKLPELLPTEKSALTNFRNKAKMVVTGTKDSPVIGLIDRDLMDCQLHVPVINELLHELPAFIQTASLEPYQISAKKGELKGIIVFYSETTK